MTIIRCNLCSIEIVPRNETARQLMTRKPKSVKCEKCLSGEQRWTKDSYKDYLKSEYWQKTRLEALKRAGYRCQLCASDKGLQVHHNNYSRLGCELPSDLVVLCDGCHKKHHGK